MGKIYAFLLGILAGFGLYHLASSYHVVRADSGLHLAPKLSQTLDETYVDIRHFGVEDWANRPQLAAAVTKAGKGEMVQKSATDAVAEGIQKLLPGAPQE
jgi:hypothetical protein